MVVYFHELIYESCSKILPKQSTTILSNFSAINRKCLFIGKFLTLLIGKGDFQVGNMKFRASSTSFSMEFNSMVWNPKSWIGDDMLAKPFTPAGENFGRV